MKHVSFFKTDYPRPQFVRDNYLIYNDEWDFKFDDNNIGLKEKWYKHKINDLKINVPFAYQTPASKINDQKDHKVIWYQKEIELLSLNKDEEQLIIFEGSDYYTKAWVNGEYLGEHFGGYSRFSLSLNSLKNKLKNKKTATLTLRIEDDLNAARPRGKQSWTGSPFGCWYTATSGLYKTVWSEKVNETRFSNIKITPLINKYAFELDYELLGNVEGLEIETIVTFENNFVSKTRTTTNLKEFNQTISICTHTDGFKMQFWTPEHPALYELEFNLYKNGKLLDKVHSYAGFREFKTEKNMFLLNQNPVYLRLVLEQGYYKEGGLTATYDELVKEIELIKALGFNGFRMHQKTEDERFIYLADVCGLFVWCEMPSAYEFRDSLINSVTTEWMEIVKAHYNHPSVIVWVPTNESWGVPFIRTDKKQQALANTLYQLTKSYDETRPVISNDGWEHTKSDIITLHNYEQDPEKFVEFYRDMNKVMDGSNITDYNQTRRAFAEGYKYNGEPIMMDEFIGTAFAATDNVGWGYGNSVKGNEDYIARIDGLIKAVVKNNNFSGFCITQITDVYQEMNGLLDFDRNPKIDIDTFRKIITQK